MPKNTLIGNMKKKTIKNGSLYLVLSSEYRKDIKPVDIARQAIEGGVDIIQMREKSLAEAELISLGRQLSDLSSKREIIFIVNDDPNIAVECYADGVHLGQEDIKKYPIDKVRKIIGEEKIIGTSTHSVEQFEQANVSDCDYIAFGPIFSTKTKDYHIGPEDIERVLSVALKPVIFIGGISLDNIDDVLQKGAKNIAVIRSIMQAEDILRAALALPRATGSRSVTISWGCPPKRRAMG